MIPACAWLFAQVCRKPGILQILSLKVQQESVRARFETVGCGQVGKEGGAQEPALRPYWRGRMGASKQDQLDLYEGRLASEEDLSSSDEEAEQRSTLRHRVNGAQLASIPQPIQACSNWQIHGSEEPAHMQDPSQCSCQSDDVRLTEQGHEQPEKDAETNPLEPVQDSSSSDEDTSSSDSDNSSSSGDDPDDVQPIQIETLKT